MFNHLSPREHENKRKRDNEGDRSSSEAYVFVFLFFRSMYENFTRRLPIFERILRFWAIQHSYDLLDSKPTRERHCGVYLQWNPDWSLVIASWPQEHSRSSHRSVPILLIQTRRLVFVRICPFNRRSFCSDEAFAGLELLCPIRPDQGWREAPTFWGEGGVVRFSGLGGRPSKSDQKSHENRKTLKKIFNSAVQNRKFFNMGGESPLPFAPALDLMRS